MKTRFPLAAAAALVLSALGLGIPAFLVERVHYSNLLLAFPGDLSAPRLTIEAIERFMEDAFLLTYEIPAASRAVLPHAEYAVTLIGTNSSYPHILGLPLVEGAFFSKQAWEGKQKQAVLNEQAALTLFGSTHIVGSRVRIRQDTWLITGVIRDGDTDASRIYVPSSAGNAAGLPSTASSLAALLDPSRGITEAYGKNSLKTLGLQEGRFNFYPLEAQVRLLWERVEVILAVFLGIFLLLGMPPLGRKLIAALALLREGLKRRYPGELAMKDPRVFGKPALLGLALAASLALLVFLLITILSICLPWQDVPSLTDLSEGSLPPHLFLLRSCDLPSRILFGGALAVAALVFISGLGRDILRSRRGGSPGQEAESR